MNWGHKLLLVIILFILSMLGMVYYAMQQTNEMVDGRYYEKELVYQDKINAARNLQQAVSSPFLSQETADIVLNFPATTFEKLSEGYLEALRPDGQHLDVKMELAPDAHGRQVVSKNGFVHGLYTFRIGWKNGEVPYYFEERVFLQKGT